jgi:hypothetical protein
MATAPAVQPELSASEAEAMAIKRMDAELQAIMREFDMKHVDDLAREHEEKKEVAAPDATNCPSPSPGCSEPPSPTRSCIRARSCGFRVQFDSSSAAYDHYGQVAEVPTLDAVKTVFEENDWPEPMKLPSPKGVVEFKVKSIRDLSAWLDDRLQMLRKASESSTQQESEMAPEDIEAALAEALENAIFNIEDPAALSDMSKCS